MKENSFKAARPFVVSAIFRTTFNNISFAHKSLSFAEQTLVEMKTTKLFWQKKSSYEDLKSLQITPFQNKTTNGFQVLHDFKINLLISLCGI